MRLRSLSLAGAKAFGEMQHVDFDDINLLFGGNSSGKSTIMQSILLLQQSLERLTGSSNRVLEFRGSRADLGGYRTFVHGHDISTPLTFNLTVSDVGRRFDGIRFFSMHEEVSIDLTFGLSDPLDTEPSLIRLSIADESSSFSFVRAESGDLKLADRQSARSVVDRFFAIGIERRSARAKTIPDPSDADRKWLSGWLYKQEAPRNGWLPVWSPATMFMRTGRPVGGSKGSPRNIMAESLVAWWWTDTVRLFTSLSRMLERIVHVGPLRDMPKRVTAEAMDVRGIGSRGEHLTQHLARHPQLLQEVNEALQKLEVPYTLDLARFQDDEIVNAVGDIGVAVLREAESGLTLSLADVGFGVSQVLPVVVHLLTSSRQMILVEQPEIHLHPRLQARMADIIIDSANRRNNQVVIETHSEHLLLRIERRLSELAAGRPGLPQDAPKLNVSYVSRGENGSEIMRLEVDERGQVVSPWPDGFFDESFDDALAGLR